MMTSTRSKYVVGKTTTKYAFQNWEKSWKRCIDSEGEYFEGDKSY
jgi:hypothetical protein